MSAANPSDFYAIHTCLRNALHALAAALDQANHHDLVRIKAIERYWHGFSTELINHHTGEDEIFYPALAERSPVATDHLGRVADEHHVIDELLAEANEQVSAMVAGTSASAAAKVLHRLDEVVTRHLDYEDADVVPLFARHFEQAEYAALTKAAIKATGIGRQTLFVVPFIALGVSDSVRDDLLKTAGLPFRLVYRLCRRGHIRLATTALGALPVHLGGSVTTC
jgi:hemerythrin-like domain-containing protein